MLVHIINVHADGNRTLLSPHQAADLAVVAHPDDGHLMVVDASQPHGRTGSPSVVAWQDSTGAWYHNPTRTTCDGICIGSVFSTLDRPRPSLAAVVADHGEAFGAAVEALAWT